MFSLKFDNTSSYPLLSTTHPPALPSIDYAAFLCESVLEEGAVTLPPMATSTPIRSSPSVTGLRLLIPTDSLRRRPLRPTDSLLTPTTRRLNAFSEVNTNTRNNRSVRNTWQQKAKTKTTYEIHFGRLLGIRRRGIRWWTIRWKTNSTPWPRLFKKSSTTTMVSTKKKIDLPQEFQTSKWGIGSVFLSFLLMFRFCSRV